MKHKIRLLVLLIVVVLVATVEYWTISPDLHQMFLTAGESIFNFLKTFDIQIMLAGTIVWLRTIGTKYLMVEVPIRLISGTLLPYVIVWLLPKRWHRYVRRSFVKLVFAIRLTRVRLFAWLKEDHMFGPYGSHALGLFVAGLLFVFAYSLFWVYVLLWIGFVQLPAFMGSLAAFLGKKIIWTLEKIPFATVIFKWGARLSEWVDNQIPQVRWTLTPEQKKKRDRLRARKAILLRRKQRYLLRRLSPKLTKEKTTPPDT